MSFAGKLLVFSAVFHFASIIYGGINATTIPIITFGGIYLILGIYLLKSDKRVLYPAVLFPLIGAIGATVNINNSPAPLLANIIIIGIDIVIIALLLREVRNYRANPER
ncbi:MAG: hypothetical protein ACRBF0_16475 [Calditrichia bacterium]